MGIEDVLTAPRFPWQNAYAERFIGSVRRECLDHVIVFSAAGLQRLMKLYCAYYDQSRTHLSLNKDAPIIGRSPRRPLVAWWLSRRSADCITGTNAKRPDQTISVHTHQHAPFARTADDRGRILDVSRLRVVTGVDVKRPARGLQSLSPTLNSMQSNIW
jgi:hypothetical protein